MFTSMYRSDKADISVFFNSGQPDFNNRELPRFFPGKTLAGHIEIMPRENFQYRKILIRIKWRTEGRGDPDMVNWVEITEPNGMLNAGMTRSIPFHTILPGEPWSYAGHYISIVWGIEVEIDVAWQKNPIYFAPFILAPEWANADKGGDHPPRVKPSER